MLSTQPFDLFLSPLIQDRISSEWIQIKFAIILFHFMCEVYIFEWINQGMRVCSCVRELFRMWSAITSNTFDARMTYEWQPYQRLHHHIKMNKFFCRAHEAFGCLFSRLLVVIQHILHYTLYLQTTELSGINGKHTQSIAFIRRTCALAREAHANTYLNILT